MFQDDKFIFSYACYLKIIPITAVAMLHLNLNTADLCLQSTCLLVAGRVSIIHKGSASSS